jgi:hypothetical protein
MNIQQHDLSFQQPGKVIGLFKSQEGLLLKVYRDQYFVHPIVDLITFAYKYTFFTFSFAKYGTNCWI